MLGAVRSACHRHGPPAREASEARFTGSDLSVVLPAYVDAVLTTSAAGGRGVAAEVATGVDLTARSGVCLLHPCLCPVRDRDDLGHHTAKASTAWAVLHVLRLRAIGSAGQVASVAGTARVLLFAATAGHAGVPDSRLIAPAAPDGLQGHGAVCGRGRPGSTLLLVDAHRLPLPFGPWRTPAAGDRLSRIRRFQEPARDQTRHPLGVCKHRDRSSDWGRDR